jgi:hypothetical protein
MRNKDVQMVRRSRLAVTIGLAMTVAAAACNSGPSTATSPSGVSPSSLAAATGQSTRDFSVTVTPASSRRAPQPACDRHETQRRAKPAARFG